MKSKVKCALLLVVGVVCVIALISVVANANSAGKCWEKNQNQPEWWRGGNPPYCAGDVLVQAGGCDSDQRHWGNHKCAATPRGKIVLFTYGSQWITESEAVCYVVDHVEVDVASGDDGDYESCWDE